MNSIPFPVFCFAALITECATRLVANATVVDSFLSSRNVSASSVPADLKQDGGTPLACAILDASGGNATTSMLDGAQYTMEREAHW